VQLLAFVVWGMNKLLDVASVCPCSPQINAACHSAVYEVLRLVLAKSMAARPLSGGGGYVL